MRTAYNEKQSRSRRDGQDRPIPEFAFKVPPVSITSLQQLQSLLDNAAFAVLLVAMLAYWASVAFAERRILGTIATAATAIANLCAATLLAARWIDAGYFPLSNLYESLFFLAWGVTAVHLAAETMGRRALGDRAGLIGAFASTLAMGTSAFAALVLPDTMQQSAPLVPALKSNWLMMHVTVMLLSYAALMVGSLLAIAFLVVSRGQDVVLRGNSFGHNAHAGANGNGMLPPTLVPVSMAGSEVSPSVTNGAATLLLDRPATQIIPLSPQRLSLSEALDNLSYRTIGLGFPLLTVGIIAGGVWANEAWGSYWSWDPKETWSLITWLVYAAYLHARITKGWQGRKPALLATVGLGAVWTCYLGVNLLGKGLHSYGWFL